MGQGNDRKSQYRAAILFHTEEQRLLAIKSRDDLEQSGRFDKPIVTGIEEATVFYPAEEYHQNYHRKNPKFYKESRIYSGRDAIIEKYWS
ncbi:hypothetical protein PAENIP36_20710 [Paenibacillus sp. P36]